MSSSPPLVVADRYRLVAPLGQGGMGRVWRATDVVLHREVAIKELVPPPGLTAGERQEMRERSLREARAIARLNNINVVRVFDVLRTDADPWIVMEYVPSRSLQDTLAADGPFSAVRTAEMGLGVLNALRAAHRAGVVHRDVKPGNVLIGADGRVVLTDFGLATVPGDPNVTRTGLVLGSPAYIAPERARDGSAGPAADLWSLGATLYAAVEGASPFARPSAIATLAALATENPPPARNAGPLKPVLNGLLRKDPTHRINAEEAERLLLRAAGRRSKLSFPMSPTMRRPGVGRDRTALTGGTSATPVVPGPRPPVARPSGPPVNPGHPGAGDGRPPIFAPGKAQVGRPTPEPPARRRPAAEPPPRNRPAAETPTRVDGPKVDAPRMDATRVDGPKVDATRVDGPPVQDDKTAVFGTQSTAPHSTGGLSRTSRGAQPGFTAADVAANRRKKAAPEHEKSLSDATGLIPRIKDEPPADPTTKITFPLKNRPSESTPPPPAKSAPARGTGAPDADKTTRIAPPVDKTTRIPDPADQTTKISEPVRKPGAADPAAKTPKTDATQVVSPGKAKPAKTTPAKSTSSKPGTVTGGAQAGSESARADSPSTGDEAGRTDSTESPASAEIASPGAVDAAAGESAVDHLGDRTGSSELAKSTLSGPARDSVAAAAVGTSSGQSDAVDTAHAVAAGETSAAGGTANKATPGTTTDGLSTSETAGRADTDVNDVGRSGAGDGASVNAGDADRAGVRAGDADRAGGRAGDADRAGGRAGDADQAGVSAGSADRAKESASGTSGSSASDSNSSSASAADLGGSGVHAGGSAEADVSAGVASSSNAHGGDIADADSRASDPGHAGVSKGDAGWTGASAGTASRSDLPAGGATEADVSAGAASRSDLHAGDTAEAGASAGAASRSDVHARDTAEADARADDADRAAVSAGDTGRATAGDTDRASASDPDQADGAAPSTGQSNAIASRADGSANDTADQAAAATSKTNKTNKNGRTTTRDHATTPRPKKSSGSVPPAQRSKPEEVEATTTLAAAALADQTTKIAPPSGDRDDPPRDHDDAMAPFPAFNRPSRPAWVPMPVGQTPGITVFGTRLTYGQAAVGGGVILLIIVLVAVIIGNGVGDNGDNQGQPAPVAPTASTGAAATNGAPSQQPSSAAPTTAAPTSAAPSTSAGLALPSTWRIYTDSSGFKMPLPKSATISRSDSETEVRWNNRYLLIDQSDDPKPSALEDWKQQERDRAGSSYRNYQKVRLVEVKNYFQQAADWEFYYTTSTGNRQHAVKRNIIVSGSQAYSISWYVSPEDWGPSQNDLKLIYQGFEPKK